MTQTETQSKPKDIHFFLSSVGGTGKSSIALLSAEALDAKIYDAYIAREFLGSFDGVDAFNTSAAKTDGTLFSSLDHIIITILEKHFNPENKESVVKSIVVDLDPALTFVFMSYIETTQFIEYFSELTGGGCYLHFIHSPETTVRNGNDIDLFCKRSEYFLDKSVVLWINEYRDGFLTEEGEGNKLDNLSSGMKEKFGDKLLDIFHITKNEAIKPVFKRYIYEPKRSIFSAYPDMALFAKSKLRSYSNIFASMFERNGFEVRRLDPKAKSSKYLSTNIGDEINAFNAQRPNVSIKPKEKIKIKDEGEAFLNCVEDGTLNEVPDTNNTEKNNPDVKNASVKGEVRGVSVAQGVAAVKTFTESSSNTPTALIDIDDIMVNELPISSGKGAVEKETDEYDGEVDDGDEYEDIDLEDFEDEENYER